MTSLVTRCPQCRAAFRVVAEQLHLRNGKVRCGVCNAVFDARAHQERVAEPVVPQSPAVVPASPPVVPGPPAMPVGQHTGTSEDLPATHVEPWLSEDAIAPPVPAPAGRLREPVMGAASHPSAVATSKREPVLRTGATAPSVPAGLPERRDPQLTEERLDPRLAGERRDPALHAQGRQQRADGDFGKDDDFADDAGFDDDDDRFEGLGHEPEEHHDRDEAHEPFSVRPQTTPFPAVRPGHARPGTTRPDAAPPFAAQSPASRIPSSPGAARPAATRPEADRPFAAQSPASRISSPPHGEARPGVAPPFAARRPTVPHDDVRAHREPREPVMASRGHVPHVPHEPVRDSDDFVAHGARSGYVADLRGARHGGLARVFWSVCCILAGLALVLQALWWWRTPIATHVPAMRPVYEAVCAGMDCRVGYVRVPSLLTIESSSIQPQALSQPGDKAQHMTLSAVMRNRAGHAQPWPAVELTLTDFANVVVVRRMLLPAEYLGAGAPASFAANSEREIAVSLSVRGAPVSGYRLALFFP